MAHVFLVKNPFKPIHDAPQFKLEEGLTIRGWLEKQFPGFKEFDKPTVCWFNGVPVMRKLWTQLRPQKDDTVAFVTHPAGDPVTWAYIIISAIVAVAVTVAITPKLTTPNTGTTPEADPVYTLKGQRNQIRLGMPIEVVYGAPRIWPSYAAAPYNQYRDNQQWLYQLFCLGHGEFDITEMRFEDTPIGDFQDIEVEIIPPGGEVTLFPISVVTAPEVGGIELFAPNEPEGTGEWVVDSEGDPDAEPPIPEEGHYVWSMAGPYMANDANTEAHTIECDVVFPRGIYKQNRETGDMGPLTVTVVFEMRKVDNSGNPIGDWETMETLSKTMATNTTQRFTVVRVVPFGRYQVRAYRSTNKDTDAAAGNMVQWEALRAFLVAEQNFPAVTLVAVKARATNNLNDDSASRFNVLGTRKLPIWDDAAQEWSAPQATRSIAWALADANRADYGGRDVIPLDLPTLLALDAAWEAEGFNFDWVFDQRATLWEVLRTIAQAGQAVPMLNGALLTLVRDIQKTVPTAIFNPENMVKGSFSWELKLWDEDPYDGVRVSYVDPTTWKEETVLCCLDDETGDNPEEITFPGVTSREQAYKLGMLRRRTQRYVRENINFATGLEGLIPTYGDLITVNHHIARWGYSGLVLGETREDVGGGITKVTLTLSEPIALSDGVAIEDHRLLVRSRQGGSLGPFVPVAPTAVPDAKVVAFLVNVPIDWQDFAYDGTEIKPHFQFGKATLTGRLCKVANLQPAEKDTVQITAVNYDSRVYTGLDEIDPLPEVPVTPAFPALPSVRGLKVVFVPNEVRKVMATWFPSRGAKHYVIQYSITGNEGEWETIADGLKDTFITFSVQPGYIYVRVAAVNTGQGPWKYWTGVAPVNDTNIVIDNGINPNPTSGESVSPGLELLIFQWTNPTNVPVLGVHIFESATTTKPDDPTHFCPKEQRTLWVSGLAAGQTRYFWTQVEGTNHRLSTVRGPFSNTVTTWPTTDDITAKLIGKVTRSTTAPSSPNLHDIWVDTTLVGGIPGNLMYIWDGDSWELAREQYVIALNATVTDPSTGLVKTRADLFSGAGTWATADSALATSINIVEAHVDDVEDDLDAAVTTIATAQAGVDSVAAEYVLKVTASGGGGVARVAGFRVTTQGGAGGSSDFVIQADKVAIVNASGMNQVAPFTVVSGIVYIDVAMIKDATITDAKITNLSASKIDTGTITAAIEITSPKIIGGGLYIDSPVGMRYVDDASVLTITGGSDNGANHGAQIDLAGNSVGGGISGACVIQAGTHANGRIELRTGNAGTTGGADYGHIRLNVANNGDVEVAQNFQALSLYATSARRYKKDIRALGNAGGTLDRLRPVSFAWKARKGQAKRRREPGLIAEEVEKVLPSVVRKVNGKCEAVDYTKLIPYLIEGWKKHELEIKALRKALRRRGK